MSRLCKFLIYILPLLLLATPSLAIGKRLEVVDFLRNERAKTDASKKIRLADMRTSDLYSTDLSGLDLRNVDFTGCKIGHVNFSNSQLRGAVFKGTDLYHTDFSGAVLYGIDFTGCDLRDSHFDRANLTGSIGFGEIQFGSVSAKSANLTGLNLSRRDLFAIDFNGANLSRCDLQFSRIRWQPDLILENANLKNSLLLEVSDLVQKRLLEAAGAITTHTQLAKLFRSGISYQHIDFRSTTFQNLDLAGVDFSHYQLRYCHFIDCDLSDATFSRAMLTGTNFKNCDLQRAGFTEAECDGVSFGKSNLDGANFVNASIQHTDFTTATGTTAPSLDELKDQSDYQWNRFWYTIGNLLEDIFPLAWAITAICFVIIWVAYRKSMVAWLHTIGVLTLFVYFIFITSLVGGSLDVLMTTWVLSLVFIALNVFVGFYRVVALCIKGDFLKTMKSNKRFIAFFCSNILMLFWLMFFTSLIMAAAG